MPKSLKSDSKEKLIKTNTLSDFIEKNQKLITVLGVFIALTAFTGNLQLKIAGYFLSLLFLTASILIWLEIWQRFPSGKANWRLFWFENLLTMITFILVIYWIIEFRFFFRYSLPIIIFMILIGVFSAIMKRYNIFNRFFHTGPGKSKILRFLLGFLVILIFGVLSFYIGYITNQPINNFLDTAHDLLQTPIP